MNRNIIITFLILCLSLKLSAQMDLNKIANEGYELAKKVSKYTNSIKDSGNQISLRTKWEGIEKVFRNLYKEECNTNSLATVDYLTEYDVTFPTFFDYTGDPAIELENLKKIIK